MTDPRVALILECATTIEMDGHWSAMVTIEGTIITARGTSRECTLNVLAKRIEDHVTEDQH